MPSACFTCQLLTTCFARALHNPLVRLVSRFVSPICHLSPLVTLGPMSPFVCVSVSTVPCLCLSCVRNLLNETGNEKMKAFKPIEGMQDTKNSIILKLVKISAELRHPGLPSTGKPMSCDIKAPVQEGLPGSGNVFCLCAAQDRRTGGTRTDGRMDGRTDRRTDGRTDGAQNLNHKCTVHNLLPFCPRSKDLFIPMLKHY